MRNRLLLGVIAVIAAGSPLFAADLPIKAASIPPAVFSWTGFYIGADIGARSNRSELTSDQGTQIVTNGGTIFPSTFTDPNIGLNLSTVDFRGGGFLGYNYQFGNIVTGVEGTFGYANKQTTQTGTLVLSLTSNPGMATVNTTWDATFRGRLGYLVAPNVLVFAAGGAAWQHINDSVISPGLVTPGVQIITASSATGSFNKLGWTIGGGLEVAVTSNWLLRGEYRYADFGSVSLPTSVSSTLLFGGVVHIVWSTAPRSYHPRGARSARDGVDGAKEAPEVRCDDRRWAGPFRR